MTITIQTPFAGSHDHLPQTLVHGLCAGNGCDYWNDDNERLRNMTKREQTILKAVRRSHEMQFNGMDYQAAAWEIGQEVNPPLTDDELLEVESGPEPGCDCGFCATAAWKEVA